MKETSVTDRLTFLAETFDVFECTDKNILDKKIDGLMAEGYKPNLIKTSNDAVLAIVSLKPNEKERILKSVSVCSDVFAAMIAAPFII